MCVKEIKRRAFEKAIETEQTKSIIETIDTESVGIIE